MKIFFIMVLLLVYMTFLKTGFALAPPELKACELKGGKVVTVSNNQWYCDMSSKLYEQKKKTCQQHGGVWTKEFESGDAYYHCNVPQCPNGTVGSWSGRRLSSCHCENDTSKVVPLNASRQDVDWFCSREIKSESPDPNSTLSETQCSQKSVDTRALFLAKKAASKDLLVQLDKAQEVTIASCKQAVNKYVEYCANEPSSQPNTDENTAQGGGALGGCKRAKQAHEKTLKAYKAFVSTCEKAFYNITLACPQTISATGGGEGEVSCQEFRAFKKFSEKGWRNLSSIFRTDLTSTEERQNKIKGYFDNLQPALQKSIEDSIKCIDAFGGGSKKKSLSLFADDEVLGEITEKAKGWIKKQRAKKDSSDELGGGSGTITGYGSVYTDEQPNNTVSGKTDLSNNVFEDTYSVPKGSLYDSIESDDSKSPSSKTNNGQIQRNTASPSGGNTNSRLLGGDSGGERKANRAKRRVTFNARRIFEGYKNLKPYFSDPNILVNETDRHIYGREHLTEKLKEAQNKLGTDVPLMFIDGSFVQTFLAEKVEEKRLERERLGALKAKRKTNGLAYNPRFYKALGLPYGININKEADIFRLVNLRYQKTLPGLASSIDYSFYFKAKKKEKEEESKWWSLENILSFFKFW